MRYLGIDWGEKRIGLALGDGETKIAVPFRVAGGLEEVLEIIKEEEINAIIIGKPLSITNHQLPVTKQFEKFKDELMARSGIPIELVDERLSSKAADALAGTKKTKAPRDAVAAMIILQQFLDGLK